MKWSRDTCPLLFWWRGCAISMQMKKKHLIKLNFDIKKMADWDILSHSDYFFSDTTIFRNNVKNHFWTIKFSISTRIQLRKIEAYLWTWLTLNKKHFKTWPAHILSHPSLSILFFNENATIDILAHPAMWNWISVAALVLLKNASRADKHLASEVLGEKRKNKKLWKRPSFYRLRKDTWINLKKELCL